MDGTLCKVDAVGGSPVADLLGSDMLVARTVTVLIRQPRDSTQIAGFWRPSLMQWWRHCHHYC